MQFGTGPFVQKIGIQALRAQQGNTSLPFCPFNLRAAQFSGELDDLLIELLLGAQTMIAGESIEREIADKKGGDGIEAERSKKRTQPFAGDHGSSMPRALLMRL